MIQEAYYLYVEDEPMSREVMSLIMETIVVTENFTIFEDSSNFMERVRALEIKPDIILIDIQMKPHDGFETLEMIRSDVSYNDVPIVALTASVMHEEVHRLREAGFNGAIGKPLDVQTFPNLLERILQGEHVWHPS